MNQLNSNEVIYQSEDMDLDESNETDNWEAERHYLKQQIKELESALNKSKKFHQKFVEDVVQSEEVRNQEFEREKKELIGVNKRQNSEIRQITKDKRFYESTCTALMQERDMKAAESQSTELQKSLPPSKRSTTRTSGKLQSKSSACDSQFKISTKLFDDNKKLKVKVRQLTKSNADLRRLVKQLENFKNKIETKKERQVAEQISMDNLIKSTTRTNSQIFNQLALSQLDQFNRMQPKY